jgi:hypothetical protein
MLLLEKTVCEFIATSSKKIALNKEKGSLKVH